MSLIEIQNQFERKEIDKWQYIDKMYEVHETLFDYAAFIDSTNISGINIEDGNVIMTFRNSGVKFICARGDKRLAPFDALNFGGYEEDELQMQFQLIDNNATILDIGANYGWYAIHMARKFPSAAIYSFEPIPNTFAQLNRNIAINEVKNVTTVNSGLGQEAGSFTFYYDPELSVNASMTNLSGASTVESTTCAVTTLDAFVIDKKIRVDFIKCDIEGAELFAFKGGIEILRKDTPVIFSEMLRKWTAKFNYHPNDIIDFLAEIGYACFITKGGKLYSFKKVDETTLETNYFFLHPERHAALLTKFLSKD